MKKNIYHFYYSEKSSEASRRMIGDGGEIERICKLMDGSLVKYNLCARKKEKLTNKNSWGDFEYLGKGYIYSINGVVQECR